jgi:hypothetical protein
MTTPGQLNPELAAFMAAMAAIFEPACGCAEIRVLDASMERDGTLTAHPNFRSTFAGWFANPDLVLAAARSIRGVSAYITINPVNADLLARSNTLIKARATTSDSDVLVLRNALLDFDAKRPTGISSTDAELGEALARRDQVLDDHPEIAAASIHGCSGNGGFILVGLPDLPNDETHRKLVKEFIGLLAAKYSDQVVEVDPTTCNPSRIMALVGTRKCKGISTAERPHRMVTLDSDPGKPQVPLDLVGWLEQHRPPQAPPGEPPAGGNGQATAAPKAGMRGLVVKASGPLESYGQQALENETAKLASTDSNRNNQLFRSSCNMFELANAGAMDDSQAEQRLSEAAHETGLDDRETQKTIASAKKRVGGKARNLSHVGVGQVGQGTAPDDVRKRVEGYFDRNDERGLFQDDKLLHAIKQLRTSDRAEFAAIKQLLQKRKLWTGYTDWVKSASKSRLAGTPGGDPPYRERDGCTYAIFRDSDGNPFETKIANFTARITTEVSRHEGDEVIKNFEIKATHAAGGAATTTIKAADFESMLWVPAELGAKFSIEPGRGTRDQTRHAVQLLSHRDGMQCRDDYTALGWHEINGQQVYLHAGGGIGCTGPVAAHVETVKEALAVYTLPAPDAMKLAQSVEHVLMMYDTLGSPVVAAIVASLPWRAVLARSGSIRRALLRFDRLAKNIVCGAVHQALRARPGVQRHHASDLGSDRERSPATPARCRQHGLTGR